MLRACAAALRERRRKRGGFEIKARAANAFDMKQFGAFSPPPAA